MALYRDRRLTSLAAIAGLFVAYVRNVVQYHRYSWDSILDFFGWWFIHYIAVILVLGIAHAATRGKASLLFGQSETLQKLTLEEGLMYGCFIVIVAAIAVFFLFHWVPVDASE